MRNQNEVYVVDFLRTPVGKYGGALSGIRPDDLLVFLIKALLEKNPQVPKTEIDEVIIGCANQAGEDNRNIARLASLIAGLPVSVPGYTVNRLCASGMQALVNGAMQILQGDADLVLVGGVESMSRAPLVQLKPTKAFSRDVMVADSTLGWRFVNPAYLEKYNALQMGETAEVVAEKYQITREQQDAFALHSHEKYHQHQSFIAEEILPVFNGKQWINEDENPRPDTSLNKLAALKTSFKVKGTVTAGNAAGINDGASLLLLASSEAVKQYHLHPLARVAGYASAGVHPDEMGIGPVATTNKLLTKLNKSISDIDLFEINEAFASQVLACVKELGIDESRVNVHGGSIAIGHPLGSSGARIAGTLVRSMQKQNSRFGIATMCVGVGQGLSVLFENYAYEK